MAPTSDERREVAAWLRWLASDPGAQTRGPYGPSTYAITCDAIFGQGIGGPSETQFLNRLADLIDPTCHIVLRQSDSDFTDEPHYMCSRCGKEGIDVFERRDYTLAGIVSHAPYCSQCGARVVDDDN